MKTFLIAAAALAALFFLLTFAVSAIAQRRFVHHTPAGKNEEAYWTRMTAIYPKEVTEAANALRKRLKETSVVNNRGNRVTAWYAPTGKPSRGVALLLHGYNGCYLQMLPYALHWIDNLGYDILIPNWENHADSEGDAITCGWRERDDLLLWMDEARRLFPSSGERIVLHGVSMGAATALLRSADPRVVAVVEDCGYSDVYGMTLTLFRRMHMPPRVCAFFLNVCNRLREGFSLFSVRPYEAVAGSSAPLLCIHGEKDALVPRSMMDKIRSAKKKGPVYAWSVPDAGHARSLATRFSEYGHRLEEFMGKVQDPSFPAKSC